PVLARGIVPALDRTLVREAARALQEQLQTLTPAEAALRVTIPRHRRLLHPPPLRRSAAVVRDRRHVADRGDLESHGLQRADSGLTARAGPPHEDLDLLEPVFHRLAGGDLRRRLGGERGALAGPLEPGAPGARPRHDVAHPVGERGDRVRALPAHRQPAPVTDAAIRPDVHEPLHVHRHLAPQVALDLQLALDDVAHTPRLVFRPRLDTLVRIDVRLRKDVLRRRPPDAVDV